MKKTKKPLPATFKRDLLISAAIFAAWTYVIQTFTPSNWISSWPIFFAMLMTLSPFMVAAVVAYEFLFREVTAHVSRISYSVVFSIIVFMLSLTVTWVIPIFPSNMLNNVALGDVFVTLWMLLFYLAAAGLILWFIHSTSPMKRGRSRKA